LPKKTKIIGYARSDMDEEKFMSQVAGGLEDEVSRKLAGRDGDGCTEHTFLARSQDKTKVEEFKKLAKYVRGAYDEDEAFQVIIE